MYILLSYIGIIFRVHEIHKRYLALVSRDRFSKAPVSLDDNRRIRRAEPDLIVKSQNYILYQTRNYDIII